MSKLIKCLFAIALLIAVERFCRWQTDGFRFYEILSELPNDPSWEVEPRLSLAEVNALLNQPFTYLGGGGQCYAFLSQDGAFVLKLFRHSHHGLVHLVASHTLPTFLEPYRLNWLAKNYRDPRRIFESCKIAYEKIPDETGLLYLHLNKTQGLHPKITLIDASGVTHKLELDATEFALQRRALSLFPTLEEKIAQGSADKALASFFSCIASCAKKGVRDNDNAIRRNSGFIADKAVLFDIGSFFYDESLLTENRLQEELEQKGHRIERWLKKHHAELLPLYEEELQKAVIEGRPLPR